MDEAALDYLQNWTPSSRVADAIAERYLLPTSAQISEAIRRPKLIPLDYMVLLMIPPYRRATQSGIIVASTNEAHRQEQASQVGIVVAIGENAFVTTASGADMTIRPRLRDIVLYPRFSGTIPMIPGLEPEDDDSGYVRLVKDEEIIGIVGRAE